MNWQQIDNARKKHIRFGERLFRRMFSVTRTQLAQQLNRAETTGQIESIIDNFIFDEDITNAFEVFYRRAGVDFAKQTYRRFKSAVGFEVKQEDTEQLVPMWEAMMAAFVLDECGVKIASVGTTHRATYKRILDKAVQEGMNEGWGVEKVAREILKQGTRTEKWQAMRIARTEVLSASNYGSLKGAETTGIPMQKVWLPSSSPDPREDHQAMSGERVGMNDLFTLPSGERLEYPGDPSGSLEEIINCRCGVAMEPKEDIIDQILQQ